MRLSRVFECMILLSLAVLVGCAEGPVPSGGADAFSAIEEVDQGLGNPAFPHSVRGTRPLLVILNQKDSSHPLAHDAAWYTRRFFGPGPSNVADYYRATSNGAFAFTNAGVINVVDRTDAAFSVHAGVSAGEQGSTNAQRKRALMLAEDSGFPFSNFDANHDGQLTTDELTVISVDNYSEGSGQTSNPGCVRHASGLNVCVHVALAGHRSPLVNFAHELAHTIITWDPADLYGGGCLSSGETLMSCTADESGLEGNWSFHLDPYFRKELTWAGRLIGLDGSASSNGGTVSLATLPNNGARTDLFDIAALSHGSETIYIEYRKRDFSYDSSVNVEGIVFWYTRTNPDGTLTTLTSLVNPSSGGDRMDVTLAPHNCVLDPNDAYSRGAMAANTVPGGSYRIKWLDGSDSGFLFTVGVPLLDGTINLTYSRSNAAPSCAFWSGNDPQGAPPNVVFDNTTGIAATSWARGRLDVIARDPVSHQLFHKWFDNSWHPWEALPQLPGGATSDPAIAAWGPNRLDIVVRGSDSRLWHLWFDGVWRPWESLGGPVATSGPSISTRGVNKLDIFTRATDGNYMWLKFDSQWNSWRSIGGVLTDPDPSTGAPASASMTEDRVDVFARGTDNTLWHTWIDGDMHAWESLGGTLLSAPAATSWKYKRLDVVGRGAFDLMYHTIYDNTWWPGEKIGVIPYRYSARPALVSWASSRLDMFAVDSATDSSLSTVVNTMGHQYWPR